MNSLSVLLTSQVVYQPITHRNCGLLLLYNDSEDARFFPWVYRHNNPQLIDQSERAH